MDGTTTCSVNRCTLEDGKTDGAHDDDDDVDVADVTGIGGAGGENNDEPTLDDDASGKKPLTKKRRDGRTAGAATLETNVDNLNQKKLDDDFEVDPLFRATAAQVCARALNERFAALVGWRFLKNRVRRKT